MKRTCQVLSLFSVLIFSSCGRKDVYIHPEEESITESVYASGVIKSSGQYQVFPLASGIIEDIFFREGDLIREGQVIMTLSGNASKLSLENATLSAAYSSYDNNLKKLEELKLNLTFAADKLKQDSLLWVRQNKLWQQEIGSKIELEQKEIAYKNARSAYETLKIRLYELERQIRFQDRQARTSEKISRSLAGDYSVKSISTGRIYNILKEKGEMAGPQTPVAIIGDADGFMVELQVDEYDIARVKEGMQVFLRFDSYRDSVYEAKVSRIHPIMNERSKTFTVEAEFVRRPPGLFPHLTVEASIVIRHKPKALTIPRSYLINDSFALDRNGEQIRVRTGLMDYNKVEITDGLNKESEIVMPDR